MSLGIFSLEVIAVGKRLGKSASGRLKADGLILIAVSVSYTHLTAAMCSRMDIVADSPVVPHTHTASTPAAI